MAVVSAAGLLLGSGGLYRLHRALFLGVTEAEAGLLLPGLLGQDVFNLLVGLPLLLGSPWLARGGALIGLLFYVPLVTLSAFTTISLVSSIDGENVWRRLSGAVPARVIGAILRTGVGTCSSTGRHLLSSSAGRRSSSGRTRPSGA